MTEIEALVTPPTSTPWVPVWGGQGLAYKGDWAAGTYQDGDVVVKDGMAFMCLGGPTAVAPDALVWGEVAPIPVMGAPLWGTAGLAADLTLPEGASSRATIASVTLDVPSLSTVVIFATVGLQSMVTGAFAAVYADIDGGSTIGGEIDWAPGVVCVGEASHVWHVAGVAAGTHVFRIQGANWGGGAGASKARANLTKLVVGVFPNIVGGSPFSWQNYTPVLTALTTNPVLGTEGVAQARYCRVGSLVTYEGKIKFGSTGASRGLGGYRISLPVPARSLNHHAMGQGFLASADESNICIPQAMIYAGDQKVIFNYTTTIPTGGWQGVSDSTPWVWSANYAMYWSITYEAA